jgi:purine-nucleoside phosphorylase
VTTEAHPSDPAQLAEAAAKTLAEATGVDRHDAAIVLGSGWAPAADRIGAAEVEIPVDQLPGFAPPSAVGHVGKVRSLRVGDRRVLVFLGRTHLYEGRGVEPVVHGVRVAAAAGAGTIILTNAAGGLREGFSVGQPVLISDHLNLTARSPLVGGNFVDLTDLYSARLRERALAVDPSLEQGVYAAVTGPHYETPAEIRMLRMLGADLVGMSTVLEAIAAKAAGADVLAVSLVTNLAAGITGEPLSHTEVLAAGRDAAERIGTLLGRLIAEV